MHQFLTEMHHFFDRNAPVLTEKAPVFLTRKSTVFDPKSTVFLTRKARFFDPKCTVLTRNAPERGPFGTPERRSIWHRKRGLEGCTRTHRRGVPVPHRRVYPYPSEGVQSPPLPLAVYLAVAQTKRGVPKGVEFTRFCDIFLTFFSDPFLTPDFWVSRPLFRGSLYIWGFAIDLKMGPQIVHQMGQKWSKNGHFLVISVQNPSSVPNEISKMTDF